MIGFLLSMFVNEWREAVKRKQHSRQQIRNEASLRMDEALEKIHGKGGQ